MKILLSIAIVLLVVLLVWVFGYTAQVPVTLSWTAPGDDGDISVATAYDMRYGPDSTFQNWAALDSVQGLPLPDSAGTCQSVTLNLPEGRLYFFAMKTVDEAGNWSGISNIARTVTPDMTAPERITSLIFGDCQ